MPAVQNVLVPAWPGIFGKNLKSAVKCAVKLRARDFFVLELLLRSREKRFRKFQCFAVQFDKVLRAQLAARHVLRGHHHIGNGVVVERDVKPGVNGAAQRLVRA